MFTRKLESACGL